jgi:hypothetical protein
VPKTGNYKFYLCSAGQGQLYLSTDDDPAHIGANPIDQETVWGGLNGYDFSHSSANIPLVGGQRYYIMARYVSVDWHYCQIAWQGAGIRDREVIRGCYTAPFVYTKSRNPSPANGAIDQETILTLGWTPGAYHAKHDIYFGTDPNAVRDANRAIPLGVLKKQDYDPCNYNPGLLDYEKTYYWRIDDVNDPNIFKGSVWHFTTRDVSIISFENYTATGARYPLVTVTDLRKTWIDGLTIIGLNTGMEPYDPYDPAIGFSGSVVQLNNDPCDGTTITDNIAQGGVRSMKLYYDNDGTIEWLNSLYNRDAEAPLDPDYFVYTAPKYSEVSAAIDDNSLLENWDLGLYTFDQNSLRMLEDWTDYNSIKIGYFGALGNTKLNAKDQLYFGLQDRDSTDVYVIYCPDTNAVLHQGWHTWYIDLKAFATANPGLDMTRLARLYLGVGNRNAEASGGTGAMFIDNIQVLIDPVCAPPNPAASQESGVTGDFTGDCSANATDLQRLAQMWLWQASASPILPDANCVIKLDPSGLALGSKVSAWANTIVGPCSVATTFRDPNAAVTGRRPTVMMVEGVKAVMFDANDLLLADVNTPVSITGNRPFTIIYKVWNESFQADEELFVWGKRNTNNRQGAVCFGDGTGWEAAAHWGPGDQTFVNYQPPAHEWVTVMQTYAGGTNGRYYIITDGKLNSNVTKSLNIWPNCYMQLGCALNGDPYLATRSTIAVLDTSHFTGALADLRIYNVYTDPGALAMSFGTPMNMQTGDVPEVIDFKDIAVFANVWMTQDLLP